MFTLVLLALAGQARGHAGDLAGDANTARLASAIAARHGAGFAALHVSGPLSQEGGCVLQLPDEDALALRRADVEALLRAVMPPGLTADISMDAGFAHVEVLKTARVLGPDLLVLGGLDETERCRRELSAPQSGAALLVARGAPCPVLVAAAADEAATGPFERILVCMDLAQGGAAQAARLLAFAARLAAREGAELHVLHALPLPPGQSTPGHEEMVRRVDSARDRLAYLCQGLPGVDRFSFLVSEGGAGVEILKHARERKADLLVLAPRNGDTTGTTARVLAGARCPVLLLGPGAPAATPQQPAVTAKG